MSKRNEAIEDHPSHNLQPSVMAFQALLHHQHLRYLLSVEKSVTGLLLWKIFLWSNRSNKILLFEVTPVNYVTFQNKKHLKYVIYYVRGL